MPAKTFPSLNKPLSRVFIIILIASACSQVMPGQPATPTAQPLSEQGTPVPLPGEESTSTATRMPSSSPTSTSTDLSGTHTWQAEPVIIEMARINVELTGPYLYTPLFIVYGDGLLIKRICEESVCHYGQVQLDRESLCRLINAMHLTGFLDADPLAFSVPGTTGARVRLSVQTDRANTAEIDNLDLWVDSPDWLEEITDCEDCYEAPVFDPSFEALYRLLSTYDDEAFETYQADRLAVWISPAIVMGIPSAWDTDLPSLTGLIERSACPDDPNQRTAIILEGETATAVLEFISNLDVDLPVFREGDNSWLVQTRWLLPYEMPQTCEQKPGLYPRSLDQETIWSCSLEMGAIPTPTPTITPTATVSPTPLR